MQRLARQIEVAAQASAPLLLEGESGTGKELAATALHHQGARAAGPFVVVRCAALSAAGTHPAATGTDADAVQPSMTDFFARAGGGTIVLDEVSELRPELQAELLRAMQERPGASSGAPAPARVVATTNRDLGQMIQMGAFRNDLYYRLRVLALRVPALRDRPDDIVPLARHFLHRTARELGKEVTGFSDEAVARLHGYYWPGNVRELENLVQHAVLFCDESTVQPRHFVDRFVRRNTEYGSVMRAPQPASDTAPTMPPGGEVLILTSLNIELAEAELIRRALARTGNNRTRAADLLGMHVRTLRRKLSRGGNDDDFDIDE